MSPDWSCHKAIELNRCLIQLTWAAQRYCSAFVSVHDNVLGDNHVLSAAGKHAGKHTVLIRAAVSSAKKMLLTSAVKYRKETVTA